jgi:hypothetical protein
MKNVEGLIVDLHELFCERSGVRTKLCFSQRLWYDLAKSYDFKFGELRMDVELAVRYLKREIARDKRNVGALKLQNFLQPDNFDADLALARLAFPNRDKKASTAQRLTSGTELKQEGWQGAAAVAKLREFRNSLGKPK